MPADVFPSLLLSVLVASCCCWLLPGFCMYASVLMILEDNLNYPAGASFYTMVKDILGGRWKTLIPVSSLRTLYPNP
ncbi:MAG: aromatic amino acid transport family protein [Candidatus Malihini olakiniferum]